MKESSQSEEINKAAEILKNGGVVIFPTDTVYGIGCRYDNSEAISKIRKIKRTPSEQNLPILISDIKQVNNVVKLNNLAKDLINHFWPGALTLVVESVQPNLKIGVRMPNFKITKELIAKVGVPIVGTSANFHGNLAPTKFENLDPKLSGLVDFVIKGDCGLGIESTVVDATGNEVKILRQGAVDVFKN